MANQNLSQFGEKLFVADADHTFIWDTANAISKRVSRNSWLNSGELTSSAPVTISQTWNAVGQTFKALVVNAAGTSDANSASGSLLLDLQVGGVSRFRVQKDGHIYVNNINSRLDFFVTNVNAFTIFQGQVRCYMPLVFSNDGAFNDTFLLRDGAANTLALRNGAAAQTFRIYNTYTDASNSEYLAIRAVSGAFWIESTRLGTGTARNLNIGTSIGAGSLQLMTNDAIKWSIPTAGHFLASTDNQYDIGASGANRPRNLFLGGSADVAGTFACPTIYAGPSGNATALTTPTNGVFRITNNSATDFTRLQFGGGTDAFPAIARDGAGIKFTGAAAGSTAWIKVPPVAVSALPLAATAGAGARAFVNDALAPTFGSAVTGGGAVLVPVYSDGSAWNVG